MLKKIFVIATALCLGLAAHAEDEYMVQHWGVEDGLSQNTVMCMLQDKQGYMWFGTWDGLNRFDGYNFDIYKPDKGQVNSRIDVIYEDEEETLWWATYDGHYYSMDHSRRNPIERQKADLPSGMIESINSMNDTLIVDRNGIVWLADSQPGIRRCRNGVWKRFVPKQDMRYKGQAGRHIFILYDQLGREWVNPTGGGFSYYDYEKDELINPLRSTNTIHSAYVDRAGHLWISTFDKGVDCLNIEPKPFRLHDLSIWEKKNGEVRAMMVHKDGRIEMVEKDERMIYSIAETSHGTIYGTRGKGIIGGHRHYALNNLLVYDLLVKGDTIFAATYGGGVNVFLPNNKHYVIGDGYKVRSLMLTNDALWAACTSGLLRIDQNGTVNYPCNDARCLYSYENKVYVGTFGGGLMVMENDTLHSIETGQDIVMSIVGEGDKIWMTSEEGITELDLKTGAHQYFATFDPTRKAYFSEGKGIMTQDSTILFGYSQGYVEFFPNHPIESEKSVPLQIRHLYVMDQEIEIGPDSIITLDYNRNSFRVDYAALEFSNPKEIKYAYVLEGSGRDWKIVGHERSLSLTNLKAGRYHLRIRSTNHHGVWVDNEVEMTIVVKGSIWSSWWMILIYLLLIGTLAVVVNYLTKKYVRMEQDLKMGEEVNNIKLQFFTNISHELRTPLTLISGPVDHILKNDKLTPAMRSQLEIVQNNSQRMLRMVNQILDFRKIQNKKMRLRVQKVHLFDLANHTLANFNKEAEDRHINLQLVQHTENDIVWVDREKTDTILYNLLSNAFKYTPDGKSITLEIDERPDYVLFSVKDEGRGIPKDKRSTLFERFSSHNISGNDMAGTGIGLNLVKDLVDLHRGFIEVQSEVGHGSTFTVLLRRGYEHFDNDVELVIDDNSQVKTIEESALEGIELQAESRTKKQILVVDDNEDMRSFLSTILQNEYDIVTAKDGAEALKVFKKEAPDLVISDLMMPNLNGIELTKRLKSQPDTSYIPIVLLTAKSAIEDRLEAMEYGADDYVTKPFEPEYLRARVRNILRQRESLEAGYRERLRNLDPQSKEEDEPQDSFLAKLLGIMNEEMDNNELTVDELVEQMGMGRTVFFNKLKSVTGLSPVEFIREIRIKRAAQLLEQGNYNISEVTYMVGMNDSRYFSKCFKATYGMTPSEYKKNKDSAE